MSKDRLLAVFYSCELTDDRLREQGLGPKIPLLQRHFPDLGVATVILDGIFEGPEQEHDDTRNLRSC